MWVDLSERLGREGVAAARRPLAIGKWPLGISNGKGNP